MRRGNVDKETAGMFLQGEKGHARTQREGSHLSARREIQEELNLLTLWSWTSSFRTMRNCPLLKPPRLSAFPFGCPSRLMQRAYPHGLGGPPVQSRGPRSVSKLPQPLAPCFLELTFSAPVFIVLTLLPHHSLFNKRCLLWTLGNFKAIWMFVNNLFFDVSHSGMAFR